MTVTTPTATLKVVTVAVFYQLQGSYGVALPERQVRLDAIVAPTGNPARDRAA